MMPQRRHRASGLRTLPLLIAACIGLGALGCHTERQCFLKEIYVDGGPDAWGGWQLDGGGDAGCGSPNQCGGCGVLAMFPGDPCGSCGGVWGCDGADQVRCADPCSDEIGCSDGEREAFLDTNAHPNVAACSGGWSRSGLLDGDGLPDTNPYCGRISGDDSSNPSGLSCSAGDLCADGWHICESPLEFSESSPVGCSAGDFPGGTFYAAAVSGHGNEECEVGGTDDLFGCGSSGIGADASCAPLNRSSGDRCDDISGQWDCPGTLIFNSSTEAKDVTKNGPGGGGVLCCRD